MVRVWGILRRKQRIVSDHVVDHIGEATLPDYMECLHMLCEALDIPRPVVLRKHERELEAFGRTRFSPSDFIERVGFDFFEMELLAEPKDDKKAAGSSRRPGKRDVFSRDVCTYE
ncbi:MAG: hypothetical protein GX549_02610 [Clostridiales bacterium]|nr:hypothetical protein [Clostridiales bacterium]